MKKINLLTYGKLSEPFYQYIKEKHPEITTVHCTTPDELRQSIQWANAYTGFYYLDGINISHLHWIHSFGAGVEDFLTNHSIVEKKIPISRTQGSLPQKMGEYCLAHILTHFQHLDMYRQQQKDKVWTRHEAIGLKDKSILILGTGNIGLGIARTIYPLANNVIGINSIGKPIDGFHQTYKLDELSVCGGKADVIINALPDTPKTKKIINDKFFNLFRSALFINVGRGPTLSIDALIRALKDQQITHAILDVFDLEPLDIRSTLWQHPNITITPHVSGLTSIYDITSSFEHAYEAFEKGYLKPPLFVDYQKGY